MKIAIIGYSGSGKSTLATALAERYSLPLLYLDTVQFLPEWQVRAEEEKRTIVKDFLDTHAKDGWVIDGNYKRLFFERRTEEADRILLLCFSRLACLIRVIRRYRAYRGKRRASAAEGCREKLDLRFLFWVTFGGRTKERRAALYDVRKQYPEKVLLIKNQKQLDAFLASEGVRAL